MRKTLLLLVGLVVICVGAGWVFAKMQLGSEGVVNSSTTNKDSIEALPGQNDDDAVRQLISSIEKEILASDFGPEANYKEVVFQAVVFEFARRNKIRAIGKLADAEQDLTFLNSQQNSLLHVAAENGFLELTQLLMKCGLKVEKTNRSGRTPLFLAATHNRMQCVKQLLDGGADPNGGLTDQAPLNTAAWYGYSPVVQILLKAGADIDCRDADGNTPLHKAVWQGNYDCVELLLKAGADSKASNQLGITPRHLAAMRMEKKESNHPKRAWGPEHILGKPDAGDGYSQLEWCPLTTGQREWLELTFQNEVVPSQFEVYAKPAPNIVAKITVFDEDGNEHELWKGAAKRAKNKSPHISQISVDTDIKTKLVKVYVDGTRNNGWMYFDAFGMDDKDGNRQWVKRAKCSSTFATGPEPIDKHQRVAELLDIEGTGK